MKREPFTVGDLIGVLMIAALLALILLPPFLRAREQSYKAATAPRVQVLDDSAYLAYLDQLAQERHSRFHRAD